MRSKLVAALVAASLVATSPVLAQTSDSSDMEESRGLGRGAGVGIFGAILALGILFIFLEVVDDSDNNNNGGSPVSP